MKLYEICFSPTGGTKKAADMLAEEWEEKPVFLDLTDGAADFSGISLEEDALALIAVPSYGGRMPAPAAETPLRHPRKRSEGRSALRLRQPGL